MKITIHQLTINIVQSDQDLQESKGSANIQAKCPFCYWKKDYDNELSAVRGLSGHLAHCEGIPEDSQRGESVQDIIDRIMGR